MAQDEALRSAEQLIEQALGSQVKELDLSGLRLPEVPKSLRDLKQLRSLSLADTQLTGLPDLLVGLVELQSLNLTNNPLMGQLDLLGQLKQLQWLDLSNTHVTALPESLGHLTRLQWLDVSRTYLTALPKSFGCLRRLQTLNASGARLTTVPEVLGELTELQILDLSYNQLSALPKSLGACRQMQCLDLASNHLITLPETLGQLTKLQTLNLASNQITVLPESLGRLMQLRTLKLPNNQLTMLPDSLSQLRQLPTLDLSHNQLTALPESLGALTQLQGLDLCNNWLTALPESLGALTQLRTLDLAGNPLSPGFAAANQQGLDGVKRYLREMAKGAKKCYEAKLLILGDGNEGKTCVSRALRGMKFCKQKTTRGVDVVPWKFAHPDHVSDREKGITLNIWDFEGQEISHQTHQFFLTSQSLYLLVFKCREQFLLDRAEYWLDTIRARVPKAKVAIVISQCEERTPLVPLDRIQAEYRDLLAKEWFFPVGCQKAKTILKLRSFIQRWAADLEFMGSPWPVSYEKAETELKAKGKKGSASITRKKMGADVAKQA